MGHAGCGRGSNGIPSSERIEPAGTAVATRAFKSAGARVVVAVERRLFCRLFAHPGQGFRHWGGKASEDLVGEPLEGLQLLRYRTHGSPPGKTNGGPFPRSGALGAGVDRGEPAPGMTAAVTPGAAARRR